MVWCILILRDPQELVQRQAVLAPPRDPTLVDLFETRGISKCICSDSGPEFVSNAIRNVLKRLGIEVLYIVPGSPWENGYAESFHSKIRDEFLNRGLFENLRAAQT